MTPDRMKARNNAGMCRERQVRVLVLAAGWVIGLGALGSSASLGMGNEGETADLPVTAITLYRSGVGSFVRQGMVHGDADVSLRLRTEQVNDILKSMVVLDFDGGTIDGVTYGSKEPLSRRLASFAVNIADNPSRAELLDRLRGAPVEVSTSERVVRGTVLGVEAHVKIATDGGGSETHHILSLVSDEGIWSADLETISSFRILDEKLAAELNKALMALAEHRADNVKTLDVGFRGDGDRQVMIGYVQEAPVWKTSYRLVLPEDVDETSLTLQGWAIVENTTEEDWENVRLSLVSGQPVSFVMDLYEPLFVDRPEVPVPTGAGAKPRSYAAGSDLFGDDNRAEMKRKTDASPAPAMKMARVRGLGQRDAGAGFMSLDEAAHFDMAARMQSSVQAAASGKDAGEVFAFTLDMPVSVGRQQSAMLPIIAGTIEGSRVSIYNAGDGLGHPMRGVKLVNNTGLQLMPGPISVYDGTTYAGDAQIGHVSRGDDRLLAYAVDLDVDAHEQSNTMNRVEKIKIVNGLLQVQQRDVQQTVYGFENKDRLRDRTLIVEHVKIPGWELVDSPKPEETTDSLYRFGVHVDAGEKATLKLTQERVRYESVALLQYDAGTLMRYARNGKASDAVIKAFEEARRLRDLVEASKRQLAELEKERTAIMKDQDRIRSNMNVIDRKSSLYSTYMQKLTSQEKRLEAIAQSIAATTRQRDAQQRDLEDYLRTLNVD